MQAKTLAKGLSKSRRGSMPIDIGTLISRAKMSGFLDTVKQTVSEDEALDAAKALSTKGRARRYVEGGAIGAASYPLISAGGEAAKALAMHSGKGRIGAAGNAAKAFLTHRGEVAKAVTRGALGGGVIQAVREGVELGKAKRVVKDFVAQRRGEN